MIAMDNSTLAWINDNINADIVRLRLSNPSISGELIMQIQCRRQAAGKLDRTLRENPLFYFPSSLSAEQSTSDIVAQFHASLIHDGAKVIDMTCGLGIDAMHIAKHASEVTALEINATTAEATAFNSREIKNMTVKNVDSTEYLRSLPEDSYDVVFIDPARRGGAGQRVFALADCAPNVVELLPTMLEKATDAYIKISPMADISETIRQLQNVKDVYAIGTRTECKEIFVHCSRGFEGGRTIHAVTLADDATHEMAFTEGEEALAVARTGECPVPGDIIFEPYPATMKAAPFRLLAQRFGLTKLATSSHLYIKETDEPTFPGRRYRIEEVVAFHNRNLKGLSAKYPKANVATRNFPMSAPELVKRLKIKEGGTTRIYATAVGDSKDYVLIICNPVD